MLEPVRGLSTILGFACVNVAVTGCASWEGPIDSRPRIGSGPQIAARPRPPLPTRSCHLLGEHERRLASDYLEQVTRYDLLYPDGAFADMQQRDVVGLPGTPVGVRLYLPAEYGMNRAYLERLLLCHAVRPPRLGENARDPLLTTGIVAVRIDEVPGGEYRISILADSRASASALAVRAQALRPAGGTVRVKQLP